jgi:hypothetical protein
MSDMYIYFFKINERVIKVLRFDLETLKTHAETTTQLQCSGFLKTV